MSGLIKLLIVLALMIGLCYLSITTFFVVIGFAGLVNGIIEMHDNETEI